MFFFLTFLFFSLKKLNELPKRHHWVRIPNVKVKEQLEGIEELGKLADEQGNIDSLKDELKKINFCYLNFLHFQILRHYQFK